MTIKLIDGRVLNCLPEDAETAALICSSTGNLYASGYKHPLTALTHIGGFPISDAPFVDKIHKKVFEAAMADSEFSMAKWGSDYPCRIGRCRGGHTVNLAGKYGFELKDKLNDFGIAAMLIYLKSDPELYLKGYPDFSGCVENSDAMADMKRCAELEASQ